MTARPDLDPKYAPMLDAPDRSRAARTVRSFGEFIEAEFPEARWRVDGLLPREGLALVAGAEKSGKSLLLLQMALCMAGGLPFLGRAMDRATVLLIEEEGSEAAMQDRLLRQGQRLGLVDTPDLPLHIAVRQRYRLDDADRLAEIEAEIERVGADVLLIGPLAQTADIDENKPSEMNRIARGLLDLAARRPGLLIVLNHHRRKADQKVGQPRTIHEFFDSVRGASSLVAAIDAGLGLAREPDEDEGTIFVLLRDGPGDRLHFSFERASLTVWPAEAPLPAGEKAPLADVERVVIEAGRWVNRAFVAARMGVAMNTAKDRLEVLHADGRLRRRKAARQQVEYAGPTQDVQLEALP